MDLPATVDTVVIGAGQSGLTMSWWLQQGGREHLVLERRDRLGGGWQDRWDNFCLVTPNWTASFPGSPYAGPDPEGFMPRAEIADRVGRYADAIGAPVALDTGVRRLASRPGGGFRLDTDRGPLEAREVVVATGAFHVPRIPSVAASLPRRLFQLHSHDYRSPGSLPPGAVLVVGSGQSGVQLTEELEEAGRRVFLSVGSSGRAPRRYRGRDIVFWLHELARRGDLYGTPLPSVEKLPDPRLRFAANPTVSGHGGGHEVNLRRLASRGTTLLGRIRGVSGEQIEIAPGLADSLARADRFFDDNTKPPIDTYIERAGVEAPRDDREAFMFEPPEPLTLDLFAAGITSVLWTSGYRPDYAWIDLDIFDADGLPRHHRGVTEVPGLCFLGLLWQHNMGSASLWGVGLDAEYLADRMGLVTPAARAAAAS